MITRIDLFLHHINGCRIYVDIKIGEKFRLLGLDIIHWSVRATVGGKEMGYREGDGWVGILDSSKFYFIRVHNNLV